MPDLTISIVNHNSVNPLRTCLQSLFANLKNVSYKIYVVDNLCDEMASAMLAEEFPEVNVIRNSAVMGFGANHNQVLRTAIEKSNYILVLNPDTILPSGSIRRMKDFMDNNNEIAVCSPALVGKNGPLAAPPRQAIKFCRDALLVALYISNANSIFRWQEHLRHLISKQRGLSHAGTFKSESDNQYSSRIEAQDVEVITGACMLFNALALRNVGLFDESFFLYFEEYDWCLRARQNGWRICLLPNIKIIHSQGYSTTRIDYFSSFEILVESWLKFYRKHDGVWSEKVFRIWLSVVAMLNIVRWTVLSVLQPSKKHSFASWKEFSFNLIERMWPRLLSLGHSYREET